MLRALIKTMRLRQWPKNAFILAAVIFDRQIMFSNLIPLIRSLFGVLVFCLLASAIYIINDLADIEADRQHPKKKYRPIPSGQLPILAAVTAAAIFVAFSFTGAYLLSPGFLVIAIVYFVLNLLYSKWLKHIPLLDVIILASFFVLRVGAGVTIIQVERFSPWLYVVTTLLALYIGFGKRRAELVLVGGEGGGTRRVLEGYNLPLLDQLITVVSSSTILAYSLYTFSAPNIPTNHSMMLTIPFVLYGVFRYLYLIQVKKAGGEPEELVLTDRPLQLAILFYGLAILVIFYILPHYNLINLPER